MAIRKRLLYSELFVLAIVLGITTLISLTQWVLSGVWGWCAGAVLVCLYCRWLLLRVHDARKIDLMMDLFSRSDPAQEER